VVIQLVMTTLDSVSDGGVLDSLDSVEPSLPPRRTATTIPTNDFPLHKERVGSNHWETRDMFGKVTEV